MIIDKKIEQATLVLAPAGRLDSTTAPELEAELMGSCDGINSLILDLKSLEYISSAGLRVVLKAQKLMKSKGKMKIIGANAVVMEVFEITGFSDFLTIE